MNHLEGLTGSIIGFAQFARRQGMNVGIEETMTALNAFDWGIFQNKAVFYYSLKTLFCTSKDDIPRFDELFETYWDAKEDNISERALRKIKGFQNLQKQDSILAIWGKRTTEGEDKESSKTVSGANAVVRLRKTDFAKLEEMEVPMLEAIAEQLWREMSKRLKRRMKTARAATKVDMRRTIRASLQHGGDPIELAWKGKKPKKMRLVVLLDVSGSMDKYSFFLLRFVVALQSYFEKVESFVFSTHLKRITESVRIKGLKYTLANLTENVDNWSSGTKIGTCLQEFNEKYAKRILSRSSYVIILSDGLDTGEKGIIDVELQKIKRRTKRLIWLNPLKGTDNYAPTARGMSEAIEIIDSFQSAHNLESILALEKILTSV